MKGLIERSTLFYLPPSYPDFVHSLMLTSEKDKSPALRNTLLSFSALLLCYTAYRAWQIPFTIDEVDTVKDFVDHEMINIWGPGPVSANNHMLNSALMKVFASVFGPHVFVYRLPNLLAHVLFLFSSYKLCLRLRTQLLVLGGFLLLNANTYFLDFFSLARGYGLAAGCFMAAIHMFCRFYESRKEKYAAYSFVWMSVGVLSNFSLLIFYPGLGLILFLLILSDRKKYSFKQLRFPVLITLVLALIIYSPIWKLNHFGALYYGGVTGFWHDTVGTLMVPELYRSDLTPVLVMPVMIVLGLILFILSGYACLSFVRDRLKAFTPFSLFLVLLLSAVIFITLQHFLLDVKFPKDRTALCFIPAFFITFIFFCDELSIRNNRLAHGFFFFLFSPCMVNACASLNLSHCYEWKFDASTPEAITEIETDRPKERKVNIGVSWTMAHAFNYYRKTENLSWIDSLGIDTERVKFDYLFVTPDVSATEREGFTLMKEYKASGTFILKAK